MRSTIFRLIALGLILSACSGEADTVETTTTTTLTTTTSTTTTLPPIPPSTVHKGDTSLLNGLPVSSPDEIDGRILAVKIDNHPTATPQSGVERADAVIELMVEGITRFITIWHESDTGYLGPVRSGRPTDSRLLPAFNQPTFAISGAQDWVQRLLRSQDIHLISETRPATVRVSHRSAPHNLYADTGLLREIADERGHNDSPPPAPIWAFGPMPETLPVVESVTMNFEGSLVHWDWDPLTRSWLRSAYGEESRWITLGGEQGRLRTQVLVALFTQQGKTAPPPGVGGSALPSSEVTGTGKAFVFAEGRVAEGTWEREKDTDWFTLKGSDGETLHVPPGKVWISLVPNSSGLEYE